MNGTHDSLCFMKHKAAYDGLCKCTGYAFKHYNKKDNYASAWPDSLLTVSCQIICHIPPYNKQKGTLRASNCRAAEGQEDLVRSMAFKHAAVTNCMYQIASHEICRLGTDCHLVSHDLLPSRKHSWDLPGWSGNSFQYSGSQQQHSDYAVCKGVRSHPARF